MQSMAVTLLTVQLGNEFVDHLLACSKYPDSSARCSDGSQEQGQLYVGKRGKIMRGDWGESEGMPVNIFNKGWFQYTLLLVHYSTFC